MTETKQAPKTEETAENNEELKPEDIIDESAEITESEDDKSKDKKKSKKSKTYSQKDMDKAAEALLEAEKMRDEYLLMAQRKQAEFENFRKRSEVQRLEANGNGARDTIAAILPVVDNIQRAIAQCGSVSDEDPLKKGIVMVYNQLGETLKSLGLEKIDALGNEFNPNFHHAVIEGEASDEYPAGTVMEVLQDGYMVKEKIIRYAMVRVAK
jgi:molecular chaperone GrpE